MSGRGILALWNDCAPGDEADYEAWYQGEHLLERMAVPGFRLARRFRRADAGTGAEYFTYYETASPEVLNTPRYRALLDNPTSMTTRIMSGTFLNMSRTVCRVAVSHGRLRGAYAVAVKLDRFDGDGPAARLLIGYGERPDVARAEAWISVDVASSAPTREEELRGGDARINACLLVETLREDTARAVLADLGEKLDTQVTEAGVYGLLCDAGPDASER